MLSNIFIIRVLHNAPPPLIASASTSLMGLNLNLAGNSDIDPASFSFKGLFTKVYLDLILSANFAAEEDEEEEDPALEEPDLAVTCGL